MKKRSRARRSTLLSESLQPAFLLLSIFGDCSAILNQQNYFVYKFRIVQRLNPQGSRHFEFRITFDKDITFYDNKGSNMIRDFEQVLEIKCQKNITDDHILSFFVPQPVTILQALYKP